MNGKKLECRIKKSTVDETFIVHRNLQTCLSFLNDDFLGVIWFLGLIKEGIRDIYLKIVQDVTLKHLKIYLINL